MEHVTHSEFEARLPEEFFRREKHELAVDLLGRDVVRNLDGELRVGRIVETEVYGGPHDPASHADRGEPTARTEAMFGRPGTAYVYQIYGMYYCLNVVAPAEQKAAAILIRAAVPLHNRGAMASDRGLDHAESEQMKRSTEKNLMSGPGKLCQALRIDSELDAASLQSDRLWIAPGRPLLEHGGRQRIESTPRIGLNRETCGEAVDWTWRYVDSDSEFLSR